jgi:hypothetical protein
MMHDGEEDSGGEDTINFNKCWIIKMLFAIFLLDLVKMVLRGLNCAFCLTEGLDVTEKDL